MWSFVCFLFVFVFFSLAFYFFNFFLICLVFFIFFWFWGIFVGFAVGITPRLWADDSATVQWVTTLGLEKKEKKEEEQTNTDFSVFRQLKRPLMPHCGRSPGWKLRSKFYKWLLTPASVNFRQGCTSGGSLCTFMYTHARWELPQATQVFVVVLVLRIWSANYLPCVLIQSSK